MAFMNELLPETNEAFGKMRDTIFQGGELDRKTKELIAIDPRFSCAASSVSMCTPNEPWIMGQLRKRSLRLLRLPCLLLLVPRLAGQMTSVKALMNSPSKTKSQRMQKEGTDVAAGNKLSSVLRKCDCLPQNSYMPTLLTTTGNEQGSSTVLQEIETLCIMHERITQSSECRDFQSVCRPSVAEAGGCRIYSIGR